MIFEEGKVMGREEWVGEARWRRSVIVSEPRESQNKRIELAQNDV